MTAPDPGRLPRVLDSLVAGGELPEADRRWLVRALVDVWRGADPRRALGLSAGPWSAGAAARAGRDRLIRELADLYPGGASARARAVAGDLAHYHATGWPLDRARGGPSPPTARRSLMYAICRACGGRPPPTGATTIYDILAAGHSEVEA